MGIKIENAYWKTESNIFNRQSTEEERATLRQKVFKKLRLETDILYIIDYIKHNTMLLSKVFFGVFIVGFLFFKYHKNDTIGKGHTISEMEDDHYHLINGHDEPIQEYNEFYNKNDEPKKTDELSIASLFSAMFESKETSNQLPCTPFEFLVFEIKHGEGYSSKKYKDSYTRTVGFGTAETSGIKTGESCDIIMANNYVSKEINIMESELSAELKAMKLNRWQYVSTLCISYRTGATLLRKTDFWKYLKQGRFAKAASEITNIHVKDEWTRIRCKHIQKAFMSDWDSEFDVSYTGKSGKEYNKVTTLRKSVKEWRAELKQLYIKEKKGKKIF